MQKSQGSGWRGGALRRISRIAAAALIGAPLSLGCSGGTEDPDGSVLRDTSSAQDSAADGPSTPPDSNVLDSSAIDTSLSDTGASDSSATDTVVPAGGFSDVVPRAMYDEFFLHRSDAACEGDLFSYEALVAAAATFPEFCAVGRMDVRRREAAAFLANISHETTGGWASAPDGPHAWGLCFKEEVGCGGGGCTGYCAPSAMWPCAAGQTYHGRGPMQLSWNYNYGQAGEALGLDLLNEPDLVASDGVIAFRAAIWFWMTTQAPKPSCHDVMVGTWTPSAADLSANRQPGFGMTVNIINGGLECNIGSDPRVDDRIGFYTRYTDLLGVDPGDNVDCADMSSY